MAQHAVVEVLAAKMRIACSGFDFEHTILDCQDGHIEGTAPHIEYQDVELILAFGTGLLATSILLIQSVGNSRCSGLVHNSHHVQARDLSCIFCGLTLGVVEICWHRDDRIADSTPE